MLYHLALWLQADYSWLRLFNYLTVRAVLGILTALVFSFVFGPLLIDRLYRFKFTSSVSISSEVVITRADAWNPRWAVIISVNCSDKSSVTPVSWSSGWQSAKRPRMN